MYEVRLRAEALGVLDLKADPPKTQETYCPDGVTRMIQLSTDDDDVAERWFQQGTAANVFIERTKRGCDPEAPRKEDVEWFAEHWVKGATSIEREMCVGHRTLEPTPLIRAVMVRLDELDPERSDQFRKRFCYPD